MKPGKALLFGLGGLVVAQLINYWQQSANPLLAAVLTVAAGAVPLVVDYLKATADDGARRARSPHNRYAPYDSRPYGPPRSRPRAGGLLAWLVVIVLAGAGVAYGVTYLFGWVTGIESSTPRLEEPVAGGAGALDVRIDEVGVGTHYTHVRLTASNGADFPVTIPLFNNCQLVEKGQAALEAKTDFSTSVIDVPPGEVAVTKEIVFSGRPSDGSTSLTLACSTLFWQGFGQPQSLQIKGIPSRPSGE